MMTIKKDLEIRVNGDMAYFTEKFYVYQNDRGIDLNIKINMSKSQIGSKNTSFLSEFNGVSAGAIILKPNGNVIGRKGITISNGVMKFTIDHSLTDELDEIGIYNIQFHLYDEKDNRITIPPVTFEVKELIGIIPDTF